MLKGLIPVLLTPMLKDHKVDPNGMKKLINYLASHNLDGLWALGSASEEINIGFSQKIKVAKLINKFNKNKMKIIMGSGCVSLDDHYRFIDETAECKFYGLHILPYDLKMGKSRTINLFEKIAERSPWPVWMYHNPKRGRAFELETIREISQHHNVGGIKIGGYNLTDISKCFMLKSSEFDVVAAGSGQLYACLALGAEAHTTSEGSVYPQIFKKIFELFQSNHLDEALSLQRKWMLLNAKVPRTSNGEHCAEEKYFLHKLEICQRWVNENYEIHTEEETVKLDKIHSEIMLLCAS